jgi:hypothetical protein
MKRVLRLVFIAITLTVFLCFVLYAFRLAKLEKLHREALEPGQSHPQTIDELAALRGTGATSVLLAVAKNPNSGSQMAAVRALANRNDSGVADQLAQMLKLDEGMAVRQAITDSLQSLPCRQQCLEHILLYLERRGNGERTPEENLTGVDHFRAENLAIEDGLRSILTTHSVETKEILASEYGVSEQSLAPSQFAITLVVQLGMNTECSNLQGSRNGLVRLRSGNTSLLKQLADAESSLGCK